jgi:hypothetical protein
MSKRKVWIILISIPLTILFVYEAFLFWAHDFNTDYYSIDRCLDNGGCWDLQDRICRKNEFNAQELCDRANPFKK